jgi:hypothetical protein
MPDRFPTNTTFGPARDPATTELLGEPISVYARAQALADRVLVDVSAWATTGPDGMLDGFTVPVAITRALWAVIDIGDARDYPHEPRWRTRARQRGESTRGRAHDVLWLAAVAARCAPDRDIVRYAVLMTMESMGDTLVQKTVRLEARIDGDGVTIGFPEDF